MFRVYRMLNGIRIEVGTYPTYEEASRVADMKRSFWAGFIGIRTTRKGYTVYLSVV